MRRRAALLRAAAELAGELGAGAVTHRAVAARAGVPVSTTSYFFSSIDELVTEALRLSASGRLEQLAATEQVVIDAGASRARPVVAKAVDHLLGEDLGREGEHVELLMAAGRRPVLRADASATVAAAVERSTRQFERVGSPRAADAAWAATALGHGAMLQRRAGVDADHRDHVEAGLLLIVAASMLRDDELDELLARCEGPEPHR